MAGRGGQTFKKRQKEQNRREKQQEKMAKRLERKHNKTGGGPEIAEPLEPFYDPETDPEPDIPGLSGLR